MEEFNRSKMMRMNNSWDIPLAMEDSILQSNYGNSISNQMMISTGRIAPVWSSFLVQSSHQHQAPSLAQISSSARLHQLDVVGDEDEPEEELGAMKEKMYRIASMQPFDIDPSTICKPKRRNVRISDDPRSMVARQRRERISEKIQILQRLVPRGTKMDTASMLDEAIHYVKFLKRQVQTLQSSSNHQNKSHLLQIPSIPILFGDPLQIPQSLSSSVELLLPAPQHSIAWSSNSRGEANVLINNKVIGDT